MVESKTGPGGLTEHNPLGLDSGPRERITQVPIYTMRELLSCFPKVRLDHLRCQQGPAKKSLLMSRLQHLMWCLVWSSRVDETNWNIILSSGPWPCSPPSRVDRLYLEACQILWETTEAEPKRGNDSTFSHSPSQSQSLPPLGCLIDANLITGLTAQP